jgi:MFS transporter, OPA family, sugar phosphate sensor protein UhpC
LHYHLTMTSKQIRFRQQIKILGAMYMGYGAMMVCRQMVTIFSASIISDPTLSITNSDIGDFLGYGTLGAMAGKFVWGPLADRIGGRATFLLGVFLSAGLLVAFSFSANISSFIFFSFLLYAVKSAGWPGMTKLVGEWYHPKNHGRVWSILSTSSRASVVLGMLFFGWLLNFMNWRWVAAVAAVVTVVIGVACYFTVQEKPSDPEFPEDDNVDGNPEKAAEMKQALENKRHHPLNGLSLGGALFAFGKSLRCWLVVIMLMTLAVLMAVLDFLPMYLQQVYGLSDANATMASSAFPLGSLGGLIASVFFYDHFSRRGLRKALTVMLALATAGVLTLKLLPELELSDQMNFLVALVTIFGIGFMIAPAYYIPMSIFSIDFGGPFAATLVCLIDACSFGASATFNFVGGRLSEGEGGWDAVMMVMITVAVVATLSVWGFMHAEYRAALR